MNTVRSQLVAAAASSRRGRHRRLTRRRLILAVAVGVLVVGGVAAGWASFRNFNPRTLYYSIECGADTYIPSQTGNPIADCRAEMAKGGKHVPPLVGWIMSTGAIAVLPQGVAPPAGSKPLPAGFRQDLPPLFANQVLSDLVSPLATGCLSPDDAVAYTRRELGLAGLVGWTVNVRDTGATESGGCVAYFTDVLVDASNRSVALTPGSGSLDDPYDANPDAYDSNPVVKLDRLLHSQLAQTAGPECLSVTTAAALAARDGESLGIPADKLSVYQAGAVARGASCAVAAMDDGGLFIVDIWAVPPATPGAAGGS